MPYSVEMAQRIRQALSGERSVREVPMFGGLSFMVNEKLSLSTRDNGDLLVRCDPGRADALIAGKGAARAEMGPGRPMGRGWISVSPDRLGSREELEFWVRVALDYNEEGAGRHGLQ